MKTHGNEEELSESNIQSASLVVAAYEVLSSGLFHIADTDFQVTNN